MTAVQAIETVRLHSFHILLNNEEEKVQKHLFLHPEQTDL